MRVSEGVTQNPSPPPPPLRTVRLTPWFVTPSYASGKPPGTFDSIMSAGAWNLIDQDGYELMLECQRRGIKVHNAGIFASGGVRHVTQQKRCAAGPTFLRESVSVWATWGLHSPSRRNRMYCESTHGKDNVARDNSVSILTRPLYT